MKKLLCARRRENGIDCSPSTLEGRKITTRAITIDRDTSMTKNLKRMTHENAIFGSATVQKQLTLMTLR